MSPLLQQSRQVLCCIGNRYVVFGTQAALPKAIAFDPSMTEELSRIREEPLDAEFGQRLVETLRIEGLTRVPLQPDSEMGDLAFEVDAQQVVVDVKVRQGSMRTSDIDRSWERIKLARDSGTSLEVWFFDVDRLQLHVFSLGQTVFDHQELVPLDVWELHAGKAFMRSHVADEVELWCGRLSALYEAVSEWLSSVEAVTVDRSRTVTMSEELMHKYAIPDRVLPVLDIKKNGAPLASLVPRGLWIIGAWGRVDLITEEDTWLLVGLKEDRENPASEIIWHLGPDRPREHKLKRLDREAFISVVLRS